MRMITCRTVHSVINRSPAHLVEEVNKSTKLFILRGRNINYPRTQVILVNDNSDDWEIVKEVERQLRWLCS